jgi:hypothetical protein
VTPEQKTRMDTKLTLARQLLREVHKDLPKEMWGTGVSIASMLHTLHGILQQVNGTRPTHKGNPARLTRPPTVGQMTTLADIAPNQITSHAIKAAFQRLPATLTAQELHQEALKACSDNDYFGTPQPPATHIAAYLYLYRLSQQKNQPCSK